MLYHIFGKQSNRNQQKAVVYIGCFMRRFIQTPFLFSFTQNTPSSSRSWNEGRKHLPLAATNNVQSTYQRQTLLCATQCIAMCGAPQRPTSGARIALWWHCVQHKVQAMPNESGGQLNIDMFPLTVQFKVLIVPSPNKKLCQLRALISTSAIGVLRIIEINLSPMCIFCIGKSSNVYIGLIQIERNNTRQYGKCRGKIFSN